MGMLTAQDLDMTPEEFSKRIPGPGSYWYNIYKNEAPELLAEAEAIRKAAQDEARGPVYRPPEPEPGAPTMSAEERRYQELLGRGVIDEQGNILKPGGLNATEIMRGEAPSWASPELIKNAYIQAFESKARGGQNFMDSGDYQNFLNAGYSLTDEQIKSLSGVSGQGNQNDLTFGHQGQPNTGVANPAPSSPAPSTPAAGGNAPSWGAGEFKEREAYKAGGATPFMDAYLRSREAAKKKGPVSSMFADLLPGE